MRHSSRSRVLPLSALGLIAAALAVALGVSAPVAAGAVALEATLAADAKPASAAPAAKPVSGKPAKQAKTPKPKSPKYVHKPESGAWDGGALWVTLRVGYNQASYNTAGNGSAGYGFGFTRMLNSAWGLSGIAERNVLGQFGEATESEIPFTIELDRHVKISDTFRPYVGLGGGTYYHKFTNTGADYSDVRGGGFVALGGNIVISKHNLFGLDGRMAFVSTRADAPASNPVFGPQEKSTMRWSLKAIWSVTY